MSVVLALLWCVVMLLAIFASLPGLVLSMGYEIMGDEEKAAWWFDHMPIKWMLDRMERKHG